MVSCETDIIDHFIYHLISSKPEITWWDLLWEEWEWDDGWLWDDWSCDLFFFFLFFDDESEVNEFLQFWNDDEMRWWFIIFFLFYHLLISSHLIIYHLTFHHLIIYHHHLLVDRTWFSKDESDISSEERSELFERKERKMRDGKIVRWHGRLWDRLWDNRLWDDMRLLIVRW